MKNKEILFLVISISVIIFLIYINVKPYTKLYSNISTSDYNFSEIDKSSSYSDKKLNILSSSTDNNISDESDEPNISIPSDESYKVISVNNDNPSSLSSSDYNDVLYSHNNMNDHSDILIPSFDLYNSKKASSSKLDNNLTAIATTTDLSNSSSSNSSLSNSGSSSQKCTTPPTGCGHWVHHDGYYEWEYDKCGWHEVWIPPYDEWVSEPCPPSSVPVGDIPILELFSLIFIYVLYLKHKKLKHLKELL